MRKIAQHVRRWPRRVVITIGVVVLVLVAARVALPFFLHRAVNQRIAAIPGYSGAVDAIQVSLLRGAYTLRGISIFRQEAEVREPFFLARQIDFSLAWRELMNGKIVSDIVIDRPDLNVVNAATPDESQKDVDRRWQDVAKDLFPIDITFLEVRDGAVRYIDRTKEPVVDVFIKDLRVIATGLRNRAGTDGRELPAEITLAGESLGGGEVNLMLVAEPLAEQPHFHLTVKIEHVNLPDLNESLRAIANVDVGRGTFRLAGEMAAKDGGFQGYIKPFFEDLDFNNLADQEKGVLTRVWENVIAGLAWLVKNKRRDQVATRIPFSGRFGDPDVGLWATIGNLFRHGFVRAFNPTIERSVDPENVLPTGESADGRDIAEVKDDRSEAKRRERDPAGAPTGRSREAGSRAPD